MATSSFWLFRINLGIILHFSFFPPFTLTISKSSWLHLQNISTSHHLVQTTMISSLLQIVPLTLIFDLLPRKNLVYLLGLVSHYLPLFLPATAFCSGPDHWYSDLWYLWASFQFNHSLGSHCLRPFLHQIQRGRALTARKGKKQVQ